MVIKVYISGISASNEVKKRQQRALLILDSVKLAYEVVDITEPGREEEKHHVQEACKSEGQEMIPLPPQFFNDEVHCGDYEDFNLAVDADKLLAFLRLESGAIDATSEEVTRYQNPILEVENGIKEAQLVEDDKTCGNSLDLDYEIATEKINLNNNHDGIENGTKTISVIDGVMEGTEDAKINNDLEDEKNDDELEED